jgi:hypothetical protein
MTEPSNGLLQSQLDVLTRVVPDPIYSERVRARCHAALARQRGRDARRTARASRLRRLEVVLVGGFTFVYVVAVVFHALASYGVL